MLSPDDHDYYNITCCIIIILAREHVCMVGVTDPALMIGNCRYLKRFDVGQLIV